MTDGDAHPDNSTAADLTLPARLDTATAPDVLALISAHQGRDLCLDFGQVTMLGARCLQVLLNAGHHWTAAGHSLSMSNITPETDKAFLEFGTTANAVTTGKTS